MANTFEYDIKHNPTHRVGCQSPLNKPSILLDELPLISKQPSYADAAPDLHHAVQVGDQRKVKYLIRNLNGINRQDLNGRTPLSYAVERGDWNIIYMLIVEGHADPYIPSKSGHSPISYAAENGHRRVLKLLLGEDVTNSVAEENGDEDDLIQLIQFRWSSLTTEDRMSLLDVLLSSSTTASSEYDISEIPPNWSGYIRCQWEVPAVLKELVHSGRIGAHDPRGWSKALLNFVTITGSDNMYDCSTCEVYIHDRWGEDKGAIFLTLIQEALGMLAESQAPVPHRDIPIIPCQATESYVTFHLGDADFDKASFAEALTWLCSAVRPNPYSKAAPKTLRIALQTRLFYSNAWLKTKITGQQHPCQLLNFCLEPLSELTTDASDQDWCWVPLFKTGIIAWQKPRRKEGPGLKIPFEMMVHLAAVENYYRLGAGILLLGFSTALVPVSRDRRTGDIQWHFETTPKHTPWYRRKRLSPRDLRTVQGTWFQTGDKDVLRQATCFLGWTENANIHLASRDLVGQTQMAWTRGLSQQNSTAHKHGFEIGTQISISAGPINISPNIVNTWVFHSNLQRFNPVQVYGQALRLNYDKAAVVIDTETKQAWLVPLLSLILHLCHRYVQGTELEGEVDSIPFTEPSTDGAGAVIKAIEKHGDMAVVDGGSNPGAETLRQLFLRIHTNLLETAKTREKPNNRHVFASELMDMIFEPNTGSSLKKIRISDCIPAWKGIVERVDVVGCCGNIGQLIQPVTQSRFCECSVLPRGHYLLAAHMLSLEKLSRRAGSSVKGLGNGSCRFGRKAFWCMKTPLWMQCKGGAHPSIWKDPRLRSQFLQQITRKDEREKGKAWVGAFDGAVVFGNWVDKPVGWIRIFYKATDPVISDATGEPATA